MMMTAPRFFEEEAYEVDESASTEVWTISNSQFDDVHCWD